MFRQFESIEIYQKENKETLWHIRELWHRVSIYKVKHYGFTIGDNGCSLVFLYLAKIYSGCGLDNFLHGVH